MEQTNSGLKLRLKSRADVLEKLRKPVFLFCVLLAVLSLAALLFWSAARESAMLLCNMLFDASEEVNAYVYHHYAVPYATSPIAAAALIGILTAAVCGAVIIRKSRFAAILFMMLLAGAEIYFGITPPVLFNLPLFILPGLLLLRERNLRIYAIFIAALLGILLLISAVFSGVDVQLEAASEHARDRLDRVEQMVSRINPQQKPDETQQARHENRLSEQNAGINTDETKEYRDYRHQQEQEQEISKPKETNNLKTVVLFLLIVVLLLAPFLPFVLLDSQRRKVLNRRTVFYSDDCAEAIRAMFLHATAYLESGGLTTENLQFSDCVAEIAAKWPEAYTGRFTQAVALWQEAAYSGHIMTGEQRQAMHEILEETESMVYNNSNRKTKFRLKYIECLHV